MSFVQTMLKRGDRATFSNGGNPQLPARSVRRLEGMNKYDRQVSRDRAARGQSTQHIDRQIRDREQSLANQRERNDRAGAGAANGRSWVRG